MGDRALREAVAKACADAGLRNHRIVGDSFAKLAAADMADLAVLVLTTDLGPMGSRYQAVVCVQQHWPDLPVLLLTDGISECDPGPALAPYWSDLRTGGPLSELAHLVVLATQRVGVPPRMAIHTLRAVALHFRRQLEPPQGRLPTGGLHVSDLLPPLDRGRLATRRGVTRQTVTRSVERWKDFLRLFPGEQLADDDLYDRAVALGLVHVPFARPCERCGSDTNSACPIFA